ncbi:hypothetical protein [Cohnella fermenti]|uniref:DUF975 family protein n=1 Tax=Cohnella fermenti TaxID=2565925 RepID=A0A4S4C243_9BACL|nr:hypothetical protein [Cohnella fermenti]THF81744.1 hypothetical protein E6C55_08445 [Cohnella fermenti]
MRAFLSQGWALTLRHKYVLVVLFLYRLLWGYFLYRFVDSIVSPVLARYPDDHPNPYAVRLFFVEAQFRLFKTDVSYEPLALLGGMFLLRMIATPLINAGLFYSFRHSEDGRGTSVLKGIRRSWKGVTALYWAESALTLAPLAWLVPFAYSCYIKEPNMTVWLRDLLPVALCWFAWGFAVHLLFQFMQFSSATGGPILQGLLRACKQAIPLLLVSLSLIGAGLLASAVVTTAALLWTGFAAIALHQAFQFVRSLLSLWISASQFEVWRPDSQAP